MIHIHSDELVRDLSLKAQQIRIQVLKMVYNAQSGHIGGAFSAAEMLAALYFHHLRIDPLRPDWPRVTSQVDCETESEYVAPFEPCGSQNRERNCTCTFEFVPMPSSWIAVRLTASNPAAE